MDVIGVDNTYYEKSTMKSNQSIIIFILLAVIVLMVGAYVLLKGPSNNPIAQRQPIATELKDLGAAPEFSLVDYNGKTVSLSDYKGKALVINSWAAWCPFCREELPDFAILQKEFANDIVVIAIDRAESLEKAKDYTDRIGVTDDMVFLLDPDDSFYRSIGGFSMPETLFVDTNGRIRIHKRGFMTIDEMREKIISLLAL